MIEALILPLTRQSMEGGDRSYLISQPCVYTWWISGRNFVTLVPESVGGSARATMRKLGEILKTCFRESKVSASFCDTSSSFWIWDTIVSHRCCETNLVPSNKVVSRSCIRDSSTEKTPGASRLIPSRTTMSPCLMSPVRGSNIPGWQPSQSAS